jgi:hypothetical protein
MTVLVPFKTLADRFPHLFSTRGGSESLREDILGLIKMMLASVHVDDAWYRRRYPDVSAAVDAGEYQSTRHHFIEHGYFEGRLPCRLTIDETWYIQTNDDVLAGIRSGVIASAEEHFNDYGYVEGRLPVRP